MAPSINTTTFPMAQAGQFMPAVGLGTWQGAPGSNDSAALEKSIIHALHNGYRLIDTASVYGTESYVGRAIRASKIPRSEITVVTKFWNDNHDDPAAALDRSLKELDIDYIDVFLMHWPNASKNGEYIDKTASPTFVETWKKMLPLVGPKCKVIGVSNFTPSTLEVLIQETGVVPAVNQVELHALNPNLKLVPWCQEKGVHVMSWSTLGGSKGGEDNKILKDKYFTKLAEKYDVSAGVLSLSWVVQRGVTVIPKSATLSRIEENIKLVTLSKEDMEHMNAATEKVGRLRLTDDAVSDGKSRTFGWTAEEFGWENTKGEWIV